MTVNRRPRTQSVSTRVFALLLLAMLVLSLSGRASASGRLAPSLDSQLATVHWSGMVADGVYPHERPVAWRAVNDLPACTLWEDLSMVCTIVVDGLPDHAMHYSPDGRTSLAPIPADADRYWEGN